MSQYLTIHPVNPQLHLIRQSVAILHRGGVIVYPTDSGYALGCQLGDKNALKRIRQIRQLEEKHNFTLVCRDLSELSTYAKVSNPSFRLLRAYTPGPYTFLLRATNEVPKRLLHPKRKTIGIRVPSNQIALSLLEALAEPILSTSLIMPGQDIPMMEPAAIQDLLGKQVDLIIDGGLCGAEQTTIIDLIEETPKVIRAGKGDIEPFAGSQIQ